MGKIRSGEIPAERKCVLCGKVFQPKKAHQIVCERPHLAPAAEQPK